MMDPSSSEEKESATVAPSKEDMHPPGVAVLGTKENPISAFSASECSTREDLAKACFTLSPLPTARAASSTSSNVSLTGTDCSVTTDHGSGDLHHHSCQGGPQPLTVHFQFANRDFGNDGELETSDKNATESKDVEDAFTAAAKVTKKADVGSSLPTQVLCKTKSRVGRENQRYETCPETGDLIRLTTGCVPITKDGSILFVSSAKKREWILPKGGWEKDETLEESALRETYEESGVLGTLGPLLSDVTYETRKSRKRRMEEVSRKTAEELLNKEAKRLSMSSGTDLVLERKITGATTPVVKIAAIPEKMGRSDGNSYNTMSGSASLASVASLASSEDEEHAFARARELAQLLAEGKVDDGIDKAAPKPKASKCKMKLFTMYVSEVLDDWPESGRTRKVVPLDEAIEQATRPEIRQVLLEIKRRNLHRPLENLNETKSKSG